MLRINCSISKSRNIQIGKSDSGNVIISIHNSFNSNSKNLDVVLDAYSANKLKEGLEDLLKNIEVFIPWNDDNNGYIPSDIGSKDNVEVLLRSGKKRIGKAVSFDWTHSQEHPMRDRAFDIVGYRKL